MSIDNENKDGNGKTDPTFEALKGELGEIKKQTAGTFSPEDDQTVTPTDDKPEGDKPKTTDDTPKDNADDKKPADDKGKIEGKGEGEGDKKDDKPEGDNTPTDDTPKDRKVIPIKLLHDEKRIREGIEKERDELKTKLAELENIKNTAQGSAKENDIIKAYAEKHGYEVSEIEELVGLIRHGSTTDKEAVLKEVFGEGVTVDLLKQAIENTKISDIKTKYEIEFNDFIPDLKKMYPDATDSQISIAKKELDKLSHSDGYTDKELDYVVFRNKETFDKLFVTTAPTGDDKKPLAKGPENSRFGQGSPKGLTAKDFTGKDAKSFSELEKLPESERSKIVSDMDIFTKQKYWQSISDNYSGDVVKRGGTTIGHI